MCTERYSYQKHLQIYASVLRYISLKYNHFGNISKGSDRVGYEGELQLSQFDLQQTFFRSFSLSLFQSSICNRYSSGLFRFHFFQLWKGLIKNHPSLLLEKKTEIINASTNYSSNWNASSSGNLTTRAPNQVIGGCLIEGGGEGVWAFYKSMFLFSRRKIIRRKHVFNHDKIWWEQKFEENKQLHMFQIM